MPDFFDAISPAGAYDGISKNYTLPTAPNPPESLYLILDGVSLVKDLDFTISAANITLNFNAPKSTDIFKAYYQVQSAIPNDTPINYVFNDIPHGNCDGYNISFTLDTTPQPSSSLMLTMDGVYLFAGIDYSILKYTVTFNVPPNPGSILLASYRISPYPTGVRSDGYPKSLIIPYIRNYLNDPNRVLWSDDQILLWATQAEIEITQRLSIYWIKFPLAIVKGQGTYSMPINLKGITRITYRGTPIEMLTQKQVSNLSPVYRTQQSKVMYAYLQFEGYYTLRLFCTPDENLPTISVDYEIYTDKNLANEFQIGAYFYATESDPNFIVPDYLYKRTVRYYICWKAFSVEGDGQDIDVGAYYRQKFEEQMQRNIIFLGKIYAAKERQLQPQYLNNMRKIARPVLPPNFGPVVPPYK